MKYLLLTALHRLVILPSYVFNSCIQMVVVNLYLFLLSALKDKNAKLEDEMLRFGKDNQLIKGKV